MLQVYKYAWRTRPCRHSRLSGLKAVKVEGSLGTRSHGHSRGSFIGAGKNLRCITACRVEREKSKVPHHFTHGDNCRYSGQRILNRKPRVPSKEGGDVRLAAVRGNPSRLVHKEYAEHILNNKPFSGLLAHPERIVS